MHLLTNARKHENNVAIKAELKSKRWKVKSWLLTWKEPELDKIGHQFYQSISLQSLDKSCLCNAVTKFKFSKYL